MITVIARHTGRLLSFRARLQDFQGVGWELYLILTALALGAVALRTPEWEAFAINVAVLGFTGFFYRLVGVATALIIMAGNMLFWSISSLGGLAEVLVMAWILTASRSLELRDP